MQSLVAAVAALAAARQLDDVIRIAHNSVRARTQADGDMFVLREGTDRYADDALASDRIGKRSPVGSRIASHAGRALSTEQH